jgi:hypothetical protein
MKHQAEIGVYRRSPSIDVANGVGVGFGVGRLAERDLHSGASAGLRIGLRGDVATVGHDNAPYEGKS